MLKTQHLTDYLKKEKVTELLEEEQYTRQVAKTWQRINNIEDNKSLKRPIEDVLSDQKPLFIEENKHERLKRSDHQQPGHSSQVSRINSRQQNIADTDYSRVNARLEEFVEYFVKEFEAKLHSYHMIIEGEIKKAGTFSDAFLEKTGKRIGRSIGGSIGFVLGVPGVGASIGAEVGRRGGEELGGKLAKKQHEKKITNLLDLMDFAKKDKANFRKVLLEAGVDIFRSFEMQFMRVTTSQGQKDAMHRLAKDAIDRSINYIKNKRYTSIAESVVLGESKKKVINSVSSEFEIKYEYLSGNKVWSTTALYDKAGLLVTKENKPYFKKKEEFISNASKYGYHRFFTLENWNKLKERSASNTGKYGYRLLLASENWDKLKEEYEHDDIVESKSVEFTDYQYTLDPRNLEQKVQNMLEKINLDDKELAEERIKKILEEAKDDIIDEVNVLKRQSYGYKEDRKILVNMEHNLKNLKINEYLREFEQYFKEAKKELQGMAKSIEEGREENKEGFFDASKQRKEIADDNKKEHEKTRATVEDTSQKIRGLQVGQQEIIEFLTKEAQAKKPIWFNMRDPVKTFTGRSDELDKLDSALKSRQVVVSQTAAITGLGGIGKSELARKYAYDKIIDYDGNAIWVDAETPEGLKESFQRLAEELKIPTKKKVEEVSRGELDRRYSYNRLGRRYSYKEDYSSNIQWVGTEINVLKNKNRQAVLLQEVPINIQIQESLRTPGMESEARDIKSIVKDVYKYFYNVKSLFIFDNADEYESIKEFLPSFSSISPNDKKPNVLITSCNQEWEVEGEGEKIEVVKLGEFSLTEAENFVKKSLNIKDNLQQVEIQQLGERLQYFPLALRQAVVYIHSKNKKSKLRGEKDFKISDYLEEYQQQKDKLFSLEGYKNTDRYSQAVLTTWGITFKKIGNDKEYGKHAIDILNVMAYLAPDEINIKEFFFPKLVADEEEMWNIVELLHKYSMINLEKGVSSIHRLVQEVIRIELQNKNREEEVLDNVLRLLKDIKEVDTHTVTVWNYASKYGELIKKFITDASDEDNNKLLQLLIENDHFQVLKQILECIGKKHSSELEKVINAKGKDGSTLLHSAALNGQLEIVKYLVDKKEADVNARDNDGNTPLHFAADNGYLDAIKYLVEEKKADVNAENNYGSTSLHFAAFYNRLDTVKYLANEKEIDVNAKNNYNSTPLHSAAFNGQLDNIKYLVDEKNADFNAKDNYGNTPLHFAALNGYLDIIMYFVDEKKADVNAQDNDGNTSLHFAADNGHLDIVKYLVCEKKAGVNAQNKDGSTSLHFAAKNGYFNTVKYLVDEKKADLNIQDNDGNISLHFAADNGHLDIVKYFVEEKKADVNAKNNYGSTPLHFAAFYDHLDTVKYLVNEKKADVNAKNNYDSTPLHSAAFNGQLDTIKYFVDEKKADFNAKDKYGNTPLHFAAGSGHLDAIKYLVDEKKADVNAQDNDGNTSLHFAADNGHLDVVKYLIDGKKVDFNAKDNDGNTPLHFAANNGHLDVVKYLIDGKKVDFNAKDNDGNTSLHLAADNGHLDIVKYLIDEKKADVNAQDNYDNTPLHLAAKNGYLDTVKYLVNKKDVDVNVQGSDGNTPLHLAADNGHLDIIKYLVEEKKADVDAKNNYGATSLHFAAFYDHLDSVKYLVSERNVDVNVKNNYNSTPVHSAAFNGQLDIIKYLVDEKNADFNAKDNYGNTPLHFAALNGHLDTVKYFVGERNADANVRDNDGNTPLHFATNNGCLDIVKYLVEENKADVLARNNHSTALHQAVSSNNEEIIRLILDKIKEKDPQNFSEHINAKDNEGDTPLMWAAESGKTNAARVLLGYGADLDIINSDGETALHWTTKGGYQGIVQLLLNHNADPSMKDKDGKIPLDLAQEKLAQDPEDDNLKTIANLLLSVTNESESKKQEEQGSVSLEECLPGPSSDVRGSDRRKREAKECELSWNDVDEFNDEEEEIRDFSKIKINSDKFIGYIKSELMSETKLAQLVQLASKVQVTEGLVNKLINNQKVMNHLNKVGRISGVAMHGMMAKNVLADFLNGDYQGVAINLGFIAGSQGFARVAQAASVKGTGLVLDGKLFLGRSLKAASPFLARGTSAFVVYDLVNQIKEYKKGNKDALVGIVGDSIYLGVDSAEIGIEIAEAFEIFKGVSSVTGPIGAAIGAVVFVGTDVYLAVKRVDRIDEIIHLTESEKFIEGLRAFIGMKPEGYIEELMEEKEVNNQLVTQGLEYLKQHSDIQRYVFPTGKSVIDSCHTTPYQTSICVSGGIGGKCFNTRTVTRLARECTTKFQVDRDNIVLLGRKRADIKWSRTKPDNPKGGKLFCLPEGDYESAPSDGSYVCENAIGMIDLVTDKTENYTLINLGEGTDYAEGFTDSPNIFSVNDGSKNLYGGSKNDIFVLQGDLIRGFLSGEGGINTLDLTGFAPNATNIDIYLNSGDVMHERYDYHVLKIDGMNRVLGRKAKADRIFSTCNTQFLDGQGGAESNLDVIIINNNNCTYEMQMTVRPNTIIFNRASRGDFHYTVPYALGSANIDFSYSTELLNSNNTFLFEYEPVDIKNISIEYINVLNKTSQTITFNFLSTHDKEFNITIIGAPNASYRLGSSTEIKIGNKGNLYTLQNTNKSVHEVIKDCLGMVNRLKKMSFFIQSLSSNEAVTIGSGNYEVIHNNPLYKSHLIGNGGENVYVVTPGQSFDELPIPEVVVYDADTENSTDTLDLCKVVQQAKRECPESQVSHKINKDNNDLIIKLYSNRYFSSGSCINLSSEFLISSVILKGALLNEWYKKLHVVLNSTPMKIKGDGHLWNLESLPLVFDKDKEIIVIAPDDVEKDTELVTEREAGNYIFARTEDDLIITNVFNQEESERCTILLKDFYQEAKMQTLSVKFADKEIILKDHQEQISAARDIDVVKKEHKDQVYNNVFNHTRSENISSEVNETTTHEIRHKHRHEHSRHKHQNTTEHQRSRRAINTKAITSSNVSDDLEFFAAQNNATPVMGNDGTSSAATRVGSKINDLFGWVKSSIGGLFNSRAALPENNTTQSSLSQVDAQVNVDGTIMLLDLLIRKVTGKRPISTEGQVVPLLEAQADALNITEQFDMLLKRTARSCGIQDDNSNFNPIEVQSTIVGQIINGKFSEIAKTLNSSAKEAYPEFKQTDKFLNCLDDRLKEVLAEKEVELLVGKQKSLSKANRLVEKSVPQAEVDNKPNTFLNDTLTSKQLSYVERVRGESSGLKSYFYP